MIFIYVCFFAIAFATTLKEENQALKKTHATLVKALKELQRSSAQEQEVSDPFWSEPSRDCNSFNKECRGCRGYLDSCCSSKNCGGGRVCKRGLYSYSCDNPNTASDLETAIGSAWDPFIDSIISRAGGHADKVAIFGLNGAPYTSNTHANAFKLSQEERMHIANAFKNNNYESLNEKGVLAEGEKYQLFGMRPQSIYARLKDNGGIVAQRTNSLVIVGHYPEGKIQQILINAIAHEVEYFNSVGY